MTFKSSFEASGQEITDNSGFPSLRDQPSKYPGEPPLHDYLLHSGRKWRIELEAGTRLTRGRVPWSEGNTRLQNLFLRLGATSLRDRFPVVAVGSNAYPRQLVDKLSVRSVEDTVPVFRGRLRHIEIVYCDYVSRRGYVPVTPFASPETVSNAWLQLLTLDQLKLIQETEGHYKLLVLPEDMNDLNRSMSFTIESSGEVIDRALIFWADSALRLDGSRPVVCRGTGVELMGERPERRERSQAELVSELLAKSGVAALADLDGQLQDTSVREKLQERLARSEHELPNPLPSDYAVLQPGDLTPALSNQPHGTYGVRRPNFGQASEGMWVAASGPVRPKQGAREPIVLANPSVLENHRIKDYAVVWTSHEDQMLAFPVRAVRNSLVPDDELRLDQMVRDALGVSPGDKCEIAPLRRTWRQKLGRTLSQALFATRYVGARPVRASPLTMERPICWIEESLGDVLGVEPGGDVVVHGILPVGRDSSRPEYFESRQIRLQAFVAPEERVSERRDVMYSFPGARFPDHPEILGAYPDLSWVWLDSEARELAGLNVLHRSNGVLIAPSTRYLLTRMATKFVLATLGAGAGAAVLAQRILSASAPNARLVGLAAADLAGVGIMGATLLLASLVVIASARRRSLVT